MLLLLELLQQQQHLCLNNFFFTLNKKFSPYGACVFLVEKCNGLFQTASYCTDYPHYNVIGHLFEGALPCAPHSLNLLLSHVGLDDDDVFDSIAA